MQRKNSLRKRLAGGYGNDSARAERSGDFARPEGAVGRGGMSSTDEGTDRKSNPKLSCDLAYRARRRSYVAINRPRRWEKNSCFQKRRENLDQPSVSALFLRFPLRLALRLAALILLSSLARSIRRKGTCRRVGRALGLWR